MSSWKDECPLLYALGTGALKLERGFRLAPSVLDETVGDYYARRREAIWQREEAERMRQAIVPTLTIDGQVLKPGDLAEFKSQDMMWQWTGSELKRFKYGVEEQVKIHPTTGEGKMEKVRKAYAMAVVNLENEEDVQVVLVVATDIEEAKLAAAMKLGLTLPAYRTHEIVELRSVPLTKELPDKRTGGSTDATPSS